MWGVHFWCLHFIISLSVFDFELESESMVGFDFLYICKLSVYFVDLSLYLYKNRSFVTIFMGFFYRVTVLDYDHGSEGCVS